jgi:hypothetical protein
MRTKRPALDGVQQSLALLVPLTFVLTQCANLGRPPGQELGENACVCIESPGSTCELVGTGDMQDVTPGELNLAGQLADNGGDTLTLMLTRPSAAVDHLISTCNQPEDQRGVSRPQGPACDVGALEIE